MDAQRTRLYEAYQTAAALIDPLDRAKAETAIQRVLAAVTVMEGKASEEVASATAGRDEWLSCHGDFDDAMLQVAELEESGHSKALALRKFGNAIRERVNGRKYRDSVTAHEQLRPKLDQIYAQYQQQTNGSADGAGSNGVAIRNGEASRKRVAVGGAQAGDPTSASGVRPLSPTAGADANDRISVEGDSDPRPRGGDLDSLVEKILKLAAKEAGIDDNQDDDEDDDNDRPAGIDSQASCLVTVTNDTSSVLTLVDQGHERGDFMSFPDATVEPGSTTEFVSVETPDNEDEGCQGFAVWEVGEGEATWRVEWNNPEQEKNTTISSLEGEGSKGFRGLDQIGQGDQNVPTAFTISESGVAPVTPPGTETDDGTIPVRVVDVETGDPIGNALVEVDGASTTTDSVGVGELSAPVGRHDFGASANDHDSVTGIVEVVEGDNPELLIELAKVGVTSVTFLVADKESGDPIEGAAITMAEVAGTTDGDGIVQFQIDPGSYTFRVASASHQDTSGTVEASAGDNTEQHVELEQEPDWIPPQESDQPTLRQGDESVDGWVEYMQSLLNHQFGENVVPHNGKFDSQTEKWVIAFQRREDIAVDGIVGHQTWAELREAEPRRPETDGRDPHTFVETGAEARWMTEDLEFVKYIEEKDELGLVVLSVGDAAIDGFEATVRVTTNGNADAMTVKIGPRFNESDSGDAVAHGVRITRFRATYGPGVHKVEAYLPPELGGDLWSGEIQVPEKPQRGEANEESDHGKVEPTLGETPASLADENGDPASALNLDGGNTRKQELAIMREQLQTVMNRLGM